MTISPLSARRLKTGAVAALLATLAVTADATPVQVYKQQDSVFGSNASATITIFDDTEAPNGDRVRAGGFALGATALGDFVAWCLDITTALRLSSTYEATPDSRNYEPFPNTTMLSLAQKSRVQSVFNTAYRGLDLNIEADSAGFQLALWEVVYEAGDSYGIDDGSFRASANQSVLTRATEILDGFAGEISRNYRLTFLESAEFRTSGDHKSQNLATVVPTPLPAAGFLLLGGLAGLGALRRAKRG